MGLKRPFDDEKFHELPLKHSRQLEYSDKLTQFEDLIPHHDVSQKSLVLVDEGDPCKPQGGESSDGETFVEESSFGFSGLNMDASFDWVTKGCDEKDATHSAKYFELGVPPRLLVPVETFYSFLLDQPPRKHVPIGPGYQATIPEWEGSQNENLEPSGLSVQIHICGYGDSEKLSGTSVIPMPDFNTPANVDKMVGKGREFCVCEDRGSIRCVRQHIKEAREKMVKMFGYEKFKELGFCDMGEEVARNWDDEDALLFHEVVYTNPVTLGRNFWQYLEAAFCFVTKKEIVSYYFNVFVLRRRAAQNRTSILDIDSDDDDWHIGYKGTLGTQYDEEDEEESATESPLCQDADKFKEKVHPLHQEEGEEEEASYSDNDEVDIREGSTELCEEENLNGEDYYFELAHNTVNSGLTNCCKKGETGPGEDQKLKDSTNGKDFQPTGNIMETYGHRSWENK